METVIPKASASILEDIGLENCRITQDENSHIKKGNGSMFAYDIACEVGKSFKVYTPNYFDQYEVEKIGYDKRLGDYLILKHGDFRFVYGHTFTELKVGDRLGKNQIVGKINKSGMSTGYHLHLELWKRNSNIKFSHLQGKEIVASNKSDELRSQRGWITDKEINTEILVFIGSFEGFRTKAYPDGFNPDGSIRYSIGKGTKSFKGEVITLEEAKKRARKEIQSVRDRYSLQEHPIHIQKAVVSFVYNIGSLTQKQKALLDGRYYRALGNSFLQYDKMTVIKDGEKEKVIAGGLVKRRQAEFNLLTK